MSGAVSHCPPPTSGCARLEARIEHFEGPLPHPSLLQAYEEIVPGAAVRILALLESQVAHRHEMERTVIRGNVSAQRWGQIGAFVVSMTTVGGGIWLSAHGQSTTGLAAIVTALVGLAGVFIAGKHYQTKELREKRETAESRSKKGR